MYERHGQARKDQHTPLYRAWARMRNRCYNPNNKDYPLYGGRGIKTCDAWGSFTVFAADMGPHPGKEWTLDRIDTDGEYSPSNCRWATRVTQGRNTRQVKLTPADAALIRKMYGPYAWKQKPKNNITQAQLGNMFGVTQTVISKVLAGKLWA